jgi:hypothetical protein
MLVIGNFLKAYGAQIAIGLALVWLVKYYGTTEFEQGASQERVQTTKDLEKNVQMRYAAAVKQLDADKAALAAQQASLNGQVVSIAADRKSFTTTVSTQLSAINDAAKGNLTDASKTPDDQLNALARQWISRLSATSPVAASNTVAQ